jgi:putative ATP-grasp target RiPP
MDCVAEPIAMRYATKADSTVWITEPEYTYDEDRQTSTVTDGLTSSCMKSTMATNKQEADHSMDD